jgi:hypothetical protein
LSTPVPIGSVRLPGVNPQQRGRIRGACHRHAVRLGIVDAVPARYMTMRRAAHVQAAAQHLRTSEAITLHEQTLAGQKRVLRADHPPVPWPRAVTSPPTAWRAAWPGQSNRGLVIRRYP